MNPFKAVGNTISSVANATAKYAEVIERSADLVHNEINALEEHQFIRLEEAKDERSDARKQRLMQRQIDAGTHTWKDETKSAVIPKAESTATPTV